MAVVDVPAMSLCAIASAILIVSYKYQLTGFAPNTWQWSSLTVSDTVASLDVTSSGVYTVNLWMREDGLRLDRLLLITDTNYIPTGEGPAESPRQTVTGTTSLQTTVIHYAYDPLYRLTEAIYTGDVNASFAFVYDAVGNRQTHTVTLATTEVTTYTYNAANQLVAAKLNSSPDTWYYVYDGNGNQIRQVPNGLDPAGGEIRYTFDQRNRLVRMEHHDGSGYQVQGEAVYDGQGQRVQAVAYIMGIPMTTTYTLDRSNNGAPLVVSDGSSDVLILYGLFGLGEYGSQWHYYLGDAQFSVRQLADASANIILARSYDPFGGLLHQAGEGDALFGFMGAQAGGGGLLYINGRYFDPTTGRFLSPDNSNFDPRRPGTLNAYLVAFFLANPAGLFVGPLLLLNRRRKGSKASPGRNESERFKPPSQAEKSGSLLIVCGTEYLV